MNRNISIISMLIKTIWKKAAFALAASVIMQIVFFAARMDGQTMSLAGAFEKGFSSIIFTAGGLLIGIWLISSFKEVAESLAMKKTDISYKRLFGCQFVTGMIVWLIYSALEIIVVYGLSMYYVSSAAQDFVTSQTLFAAMIQTDYIRALIPLGDSWLLIRLAVLFLVYANAVSLDTLRLYSQGGNTSDEDGSKFSPALGFIILIEGMSGGILSGRFDEIIISLFAVTFVTIDIIYFVKGRRKAKLNG